MADIDARLCDSLCHSPIAILKTENRGGVWALAATKDHANLSKLELASCRMEATRGLRSDVCRMSHSEYVLHDTGAVPSTFSTGV